MKLNARLYPVNRAVFCPRDAKWTSSEHCRECKFAQTDEMPHDGQVVVCQPEIHSSRRVLEAMIHA